MKKIITAALSACALGAITLAVGFRCRKNHRRQAHPPESNSSDLHHPNNLSAVTPAAWQPRGHRKGDARNRDKKTELHAVGRTLAVLSNPAVRQALAPFWQTDDMLLQLHRLARLHSKLLGFAQWSGKAAPSPAAPIHGLATAPDPHNCWAANPSADSSSSPAAEQARADARMARLWQGSPF